MDTSTLIEKEVSAQIYYGENGWEGAVQLLNSNEHSTLAPTDDTGFVTATAAREESESNYAGVETEENKPIESITTEKRKFEVPESTNFGKIPVSKHLILF